MSKLILTRHGQSTWNAENRFTGWVDVDLSEKGILEAQKSGQLIKDLNINIIMTMTHSGSTARMISKYRPPSNVIALTPFNSIIRQLRLIWGITPIKVDKYDDIDLIPELCKSVINTNKLLSKGEKFIITGGVPMGVSGTTNYLSVQTNDN